MRRRGRILLLIGILSLLACAIMVVYPLDRDVFGRKGMRLGLDLKGGTQLVYQVDEEKFPQWKDWTSAERDSAMEGVKQKIGRRADMYGVSEPIIQRQGEDRILVQLPGVKDIDEAIELIGETAFLSFWELDAEENWTPAMSGGNWLTGQYFKSNAHVELDELNQPLVAFELKPEGATMFADITGRNVGKPLAIYLDNEFISAPVVQSQITGGRGVITGVGTIEVAETLAIQLNSGALDVPLAIIQQQDVDPTLGADSIRRSILAGGIGLGLILLFMVIYYRLPGVLACFALLIYGAVVLAIFKLVPVTLSLAGIAGFILSLGMAVDANVLIFERMKEELREGRTYGAAVETGFSRAWTAIWVSNVTTIIVCIILYWFGSRFGTSPVMGFALTLLIGVMISMFTAIVVTRTFLRFFSGTRIARKLWLFKAG